MLRRTGEARLQHSRTLWFLGIVVASFAVYLPSYHFDTTRHEGFVWDDDDHFLNDPLIRSNDGWWRIWVDPQPGIVGAEGGAVVWNYWPLTRMSFWVDRHLWGTDANGMPNLVAARLTNVALHAANAILLALVLKRLGFPGAEVAGLLFAVHPVAVESVAWITERKALLSTTLFFVSLLGWLRFESTGRSRWYLFTGFSFALTLLAKTSTVMFPVLLVMLHWHARRRWNARAVLRLAPLFSMSLIAGVTSIVFERFFIGSQGSLFQATLAERFATAGWIVWFYLGKTILPLGVSFNYPRFDIDVDDLLHFAPVAALLLASAILWQFRTGWARPVILAFGAFLANLFPVMGFFDVYGMRYAQVADHWLYLAMTSILALQAAAAVKLLQRTICARPGFARPATLLAGSMLLLVATGFGVLSNRHSSAFVDRETLWKRTLVDAPNSFLANNNLGVMRLAEGRHEEAIAHFERAIETQPSSVEAWVNAGNALDASGRGSEAVSRWERAIEVDPRQPVALYNLSVARIKAGRLDQAEFLALRALEVDPRDPRALQSIQYIYEQQGRTAAFDVLLDRARQSPALDRGARGRAVVAVIGAAFGIALFACAGIACFDAYRPSSSPSG